MHQREILPFSSADLPAVTMALVPLPVLRDQWVSTLAAQHLGLKNIWMCKPLAIESEILIQLVWEGAQASAYIVDPQVIVACRWV